MSEDGDEGTPVPAEDAEAEQLLAGIMAADGEDEETPSQQFRRLVEKRSPRRTLPLVR